jgi:protein involved in polysaccharide export with SLBB domain
MEEVVGQEKVSISGFVNAPKTIFWREDLSLFDLIFSAVSFDEVAFKTKVLASRVDVLRLDENTGQYVKSQYSLDDINRLSLVELMPNDKVVLYSKNVTEDLTLIVTVKGQVINPGQYQLQKTMYVEDAILAAGGFTEIAEKTKVTINSLDRNVLAGTYSSASSYTIDVDYLLGKKAQPENPMLLQNDDIITVAAPIRAKAQPVVQVFGEVNYPRSVVVEGDQTGLKDVINAVGGLSNLAYLKSSYVLRDSILLNIDLKAAFEKNTLDLFDGDQLIIGSKLMPVQTKGAVLNPAGFKWQKGKRAKYYIKNSGGKTKRIESMYVKHANGQSQKIGFLKNPVVHPGSEIIVIAKPEKTGENSGKFLDDFVRIFGVVTGALTTVLLATKL